MRVLLIIFGILVSYSGCQAMSAVTGINLKTYRYNNQTTINVLTLDPSKVKITAVRAQDVGPGLHTVADMAKHFSALAGINGGFFRLKDQASTLLLPAGVLKTNNNWHGIAYKSRGAIGWDPDSDLVLMDILQTDSKIKIKNKTLPINAINTVLGINRASLFSDSYIDPVNIKQNKAFLISNQQIAKIYDQGDVTIQSGSYLYYLNGKLQKQVEDLNVGDSVEVDIKILPQLKTDNTKLWNKLPFIVGGGPLLVMDAQKITDFSREKMLDQFINGKYARTAIGVLANKQLVFVVTEHMLSPEAAGLSIPELAEFMHSLGCVAALNLDGGGSSAMYTIDQDLSFGRPVADALLVMARN